MLLLHKSVLNVFTSAAVVIVLRLGAKSILLFVLKGEFKVAGILDLAFLSLVSFEVFFFFVL